MSELVLETIETYNNYLGNVPKGCRAIASLLRTDDIPQAINYIVQFTRGMSWLINAAELLTKQGIKVSLPVNQLEEFLQEINDGLSSEDFFLVADLFEFVIAPKIELFKIINVEQ